MDALFDAGIVLCTSGVLDTFRAREINDALRRHLSGDWGEMPPEDKRLNDLALRQGGRLFSSYTYRGHKLWVITYPGDTTTLLLPEEY